MVGDLFDTRSTMLKITTFVLFLVAYFMISQASTNHDCEDTLPDCGKYEEGGCSYPFRNWAAIKCRKTCGLCHQRRSALAQEECKDRIDNCDSFASGKCQGTYEHWAEINCRKSCGFCGSTTPTTTTTTTTTPSTTPKPLTTTNGPLCKDRLPNCGNYGPSGCKGKYVKWAKQNCAKTCGFCGATTIPVPTTTTSTTTTAATTTPIAPPLCKDLLPDCKAYGPDACKGKYEPWAKQKCRKTCGFCGPVTTPTTPKTPPTPGPKCEDHLDDCKAYGSDACKGDYIPWAKKNCRKTCGFCGPATTAPPLTKPTRPAPVCKDHLPNCKEYGTSACKGEYVQWARENCKKTCGFCSGGGPTTPLPGKYCEFNFKKYRIGESWNDGCYGVCKCTFESEDNPIYCNSIPQKGCSPWTEAALKKAQAEWKP